MKVLKPENRFELAERHSLIELLVFGKPLVVLERGTPRGLVERRQPSRNRPPFNHRQTRMGEAGQASHDDRQENQHGADEKPDRHGTHDSHPGIGICGRGSRHFRDVHDFRRKREMTTRDGSRPLVVRTIPFNLRAVHDTTVVVVEGVPPVQNRAIIPHQEVAHLPSMVPSEGTLGRMGPNGIQQGVALFHGGVPERTRSAGAPETGRDVRFPDASGTADVELPASGSRPSLRRSPGAGILHYSCCDRARRRGPRALSAIHPAASRTRDTCWRNRYRRRREEPPGRIGWPP